MLACTRRNWFFCSAMMLTMSSTAFPNVALSNPPICGPTASDSSSVANESSAARGTIARKLSTKMAPGGRSKAPAMMPTGTKMSKMLM